MWLRSRWIHEPTVGVIAVYAALTVSVGVLLTILLSVAYSSTGGGPAPGGWVGPPAGGASPPATGPGADPGPGASPVPPPTPSPEPAPPGDGATPAPSPTPGPEPPGNGGEESGPEAETPEEEGEEGGSGPDGEPGGGPGATPAPTPEPTPDPALALLRCTGDEPMRYPGAEALGDVAETVARHLAAGNPLAAEETGWQMALLEESRLEIVVLDGTNDPAESVLRHLRDAAAENDWEFWVETPSHGFMELQCRAHDTNLVIVTFEAGEIVPVEVPQAGYMLVLYR